MLACWDEWVADRLDPALFGTHSLCRTKATLIYKRTGNLRAVQISLGHRKIEGTVRSFGVDLEDALALSERAGRLTTPAGERLHGSRQPMR